MESGRVAGGVGWAKTFWPVRSTQFCHASKIQEALAAGLAGHERGVD